MGLRLQGVFYSERNTQYAVNIYDANYSGSAIPFDATSFAITWTGEDEKERFVPILGSQAKLGLIVDSQDLQDFIDDLVTVEEGDLVLNVQYSDISGLHVNWCGYILADLVNIEDVPLDLGYVASITATDALGVLKGIEYRPLGGPYVGYSTFTEVILKCLNKLTAFDGIIDGFDPAYKFLRIVANWHEDSYTYANTINPLSRARISENCFYWIDTKGNYRYYSCYDVLKFICTAWGARMFFSGTSFYFVQVNEMRSPSAVNVFCITKTGTQTIESAKDLRLTHTQNVSTADIIRFSGGNFAYYAPYRKVTVDYLHIQARNILVGQTFTQNTSAYTDFGFVTDNGQTAQIAFASTLKYQVERNPFTGVAYWMVWRLKLQVGLFTLKGQDGATEWSTTATDWYFLTSERIDQETGSFVSRIEFVTPPLPANTTGQIVFNFQAHKAFDELGNELVISTSAGEVTYSFALGPSYLEVLQTGNFDDQSDIYRYASESNKAASKELKVETRIGDGPNEVSPGAIQVQNNSSAWVQSNLWRVANIGTAKEFGQLLANEIIRGQISPVLRMQGMTFRNNATPAKCLQPHFAINYDGANWLFMGGTFDFDREFFNGDWVKMQTDSDYTELTRELILEDDKDAVSTVRSSIRSSGIGGYIAGATLSPNVRAVNVFKEEFIGVSSPVLTITRNSGILPVNTQQIQVYQNQGLLVDSQWSKTGVGTITIDSVTHWDGSNYTIVFAYIE